MLALHVNFRDHGMRWPLHDHYDVEIWTTGHVLVATLSGRFVRQLVEIHLATGLLHREVAHVIAPQIAPRMPPAVLPSRERRDERRKQRRSRKN